jgi:Na+-transporting NADH:ubiquinone oxidoreductase subunit NqrB
MYNHTFDLRNFLDLKSCYHRENEGQFYYSHTLFWVDIIFLIGKISHFMILMSYIIVIISYEKYYHIVWYPILLFYLFNIIKNKTEKYQLT